MSIPLKDKNNLKAKINFVGYSKNIKEKNMLKNTEKKVVESSKQEQLTMVDNIVIGTSELGNFKI